MKITKWKSVYKEDIRINLDIGDEFLHGKFKNKRSVVAGFKKNAKGDDVIVKPNICTSWHSYEYAATSDPFVTAEIENYVKRLVQKELG